MVLIEKLSVDFIIYCMFTMWNKDLQTWFKRISYDVCSKYQFIFKHGIDRGFLNETKEVIIFCYEVGVVNKQNQ